MDSQRWLMGYKFNYEIDYINDLHYIRGTLNLDQATGIILPTNLFVYRTCRKKINVFHYEYFNFFIIRFPTALNSCQVLKWNEN